MMGRDRGRKPGLKQVLSWFETRHLQRLHRIDPHQGADARHQRARRFSACRTYLGSYICHDFKSADAHSA